jgi:diketogulonate reductase-like aldo/keto reductase
VQAYSPLGGDAHAALLGSAVVKAIAVAHNKSTAQVCLRWVLQLGHALTTSTTSKAYMQEDLGAWGWTLTLKEMAVITALTVAPDDPVKSMCLLK